MSFLKFYKIQLKDTFNEFLVGLVVLLCVQEVPVHYHRVRLKQVSVLTQHC